MLLVLHQLSPMTVLAMKVQRSTVSLHLWLTAAVQLSRAQRSLRCVSRCDGILAPSEISVLLTYLAWLLIIPFTLFTLDYLKGSSLPTHSHSERTYSIWHTNILSTSVAKDHT